MKPYYEGMEERREVGEEDKGKAGEARGEVRMKFAGCGQTQYGIGQDKAGYIASHVTCGKSGAMMR